MTEKETYLGRKYGELGNKFDPSELADQFWPYLHDQTIRVTVSRTFPSGEAYTRTGSVGITTGWRPCFLLMSRITAIGSSDRLSKEDRIVSVRKRRIRR